MEPQIQYTRTSDGVSIAYCIMGDGMPVVFPSNVWGDLHWYSNDPGARRAVDAFIASGCRVIRYDGRGMGSSERQVTDFSLPARMRDLEAVVHCGQLDTFALCGYSQGGPTAVAYAVEHPDRVSHLILVNTFASVAAYYETVPVMQAVGGMRAVADAQWEFFTRSVASAVTGFTDAEAARHIASVFASGMSADAFFDFRDAGYQIDVTELLPHVQVPVIVIHDRSVNYAGQGLLQPMATGIPNARFVSTDDYVRAAVDFLGLEPRASVATETNRGGAGTAVILFADIVNSTALAEQLGNTTFRERSRTVEERVRERIAAHAGTAVEGRTLGDGVLATFVSASDAIAAAVECASAGEDVGLALHLGVHAGDVMRENGNVHGQAVSIASRVSDLSAPNEVLVSATVRDIARASAGVAFDDRGEHELKGVSEPVRVFAVREGG